jgi:hypothetical protein
MHFSPLFNHFFQYTEQKIGFFYYKNLYFCSFFYIHEEKRIFLKKKKEIKTGFIPFIAECKVYMFHIVRIQHVTKNMNYIRTIRHIFIFTKSGDAYERFWRKN